MQEVELTTAIPRINIRIKCRCEVCGADSGASIGGADFHSSVQLQTAAELTVGAPKRTVGTKTPAACTGGVIAFGLFVGFSVRGTAPQISLVKAEKSSGLRAVASHPTVSRILRFRHYCRSSRFRYQGCRLHGPRFVRCTTKPQRTVQSVVNGQGRCTYESSGFCARDCRMIHLFFHI